MKYIRKQATIEAFQFGVDKAPSWFIDAQYWGDISEVITTNNNKKAVVIKTKEGELTAYEGYYIIRNHNKELYPLKEVIFKQCYERLRGA